MMLVSLDIGDGTVEYKVYDDSANSWSTDFTNLPVGATDSMTYTHTLSGAVDIVSGRLGLDKAFVASVWGNYQFGLFLDQTIIQTLEDEARWAIQNKLTDKPVVPNYFDYISVDALRKAAPEKVQIKK